MQQVKEHGKTPQDQTNEGEIGDLPDKEFGVLIVKMIQNLGNEMEAQIDWRHRSRRFKEFLTRNV